MSCFWNTIRVVGKRLRTHSNLPSMLEIRKQLVCTANFEKYLIGFCDAPENRRKRSCLVVALPSDYPRTERTFTRHRRICRFPRVPAVRAARHLVLATDPRKKPAGDKRRHGRLATTNALYVTFARPAVALAVREPPAHTFGRANSTRRWRSRGRTRRR